MKTARPPRTSRVRSAPLAIFVATRAEMKPIATALQPTGPSASRSDLIVRIGVGGRDLLLVKTGVGPDRAEAAARHLFEAEPVVAALSLGVAGGLSPQAQTGDLIVGDRVILQCSGQAPVDGTQDGLRPRSGQDLQGQQGSRLEDFPCDVGLRQAAMTVIRRLDSRHRLGPILTVDHILTTEEKRVLAAESGALAVDMESAAIASAASACSIPFLAIRGILDPVHEDLAVGLDQFLDAEGEPHLPRLMRYLIAHPFAIPYLIGLGFRTRAVCTRLGRLLQELSTTLS
ncbi:hypothetical protein [Candidatus Methylomirabilis sp.]|uniref:Nucleoside phosphorylase domain-containing protein n=1 Tax=Candidatus Methylomirabilis tolerans TaxID=3123416 RepID=A0AAJ1EJS6_9BACT|nr:hypothetical protein [Candidatus Methylomirabilis sp.]